MKFKTRIAMESKPGFDMNAVVAPFGLNASLHGGGKATIGAVSIAVSEIPIRLTIPFLKRRKPPLFVSIGRFRVTLNPIEVNAEGIKFDMEGVIGTKGINAEVKGKVDCKTEMVADGTLTGKLNTMSVELKEEEPSEKPPLTHVEKRS